MTVNALSAHRSSPLSPDLPVAPDASMVFPGASGGYSEVELVTDPLLVLRCIDPRVYSQCPPLVEVLLRVLDAFLLASRAHLTTHIQQVSQRWGTICELPWDFFLIVSMLCKIISCHGKITMHIGNYQVDSSLGLVFCNITFHLWISSHFHFIICSTWHIWP